MLGGLVVLSMFVTHGAIFLTLKTSGGIRHDARELGSRLAVVTVVLSAAFLGWTIASDGDARSAILAIAVVAGVAGAAVANARGRDGVAFFLTACAIVLLVATYFSLLYPNVMPSTIGPRQQSDDCERKFVAVHTDADELGRSFSSFPSSWLTRHGATGCSANG